MQQCSEGERDYIFISHSKEKGNLSQSILCNNFLLLIVQELGQGSILKSCVVLAINNMIV